MQPFSGLYAKLSLVLLSVLWAAPPPAGSNTENANPLLIQTPKVVTLVKVEDQIFYEGGVAHAPTKALWTNSEPIKVGNESVIVTNRVTGLEYPDAVHVEQINHTIPHPIGGIHYIANRSLGDVILFVAQGTKDVEVSPAGIYAIKPYPPYNFSLVIGSYGDYPFNSLDDVTVTSNGTLRFTDPPYGKPRSATTGGPSVTLMKTLRSRVVADGFGRPNGIAGNADGSRIYIGDTGANVGNGTADLQGPRTIYAYNRCGPMLRNRSVCTILSTFRSGPDGIKVDTKGNVWSGIAGEGVVIWNPDGTLLGSIPLNTTVGKVGFGEPGELFVMGEMNICKIVSSTDVVGVNV